MTEHKNIHEAKLAVMADVPYLQKRESKELKYTFASEADLIHKLRVSMLEHGINVSPIDVAPIVDRDITSNRGSVGHLARFLFTFLFHHCPSDTSVTVRTVGEAIDWGDKAAAKASTIGLKYALRQFFLIETGDDPDIVNRFQDAENSQWVRKAVEKLEKCRDEKALTEQFERFRRTDDNGEPLFTDEQLSELATYRERVLAKLRKGTNGR